MRARSLILENVDGTQPGGTERPLRAALDAAQPVDGHQHDDAHAGRRARPRAHRLVGDGAPGPGRLADFTNGAINQHFTRSLNRVAGTDFRVATEDEGQRRRALHARARPQERDRPRRRSASATRAPMPAASASSRWAATAATTTPAPTPAAAHSDVNRNFNTNVEAARNAALAGFPRDGGFGQAPRPTPTARSATRPSTRRRSSRRPTPVRSSTPTPPSAARPRTTPRAPTPSSRRSPSTPRRPSPTGRAATAQPLAINATDITNIGRFLRAVNAVFNIQMATKRLQGSQHRQPLRQRHASQLAVQRRLLSLAIVEVDDAISVLRGPRAAP